MFCYRTFYAGGPNRNRCRKTGDIYISPAALTDKLGEFYTFFPCIEPAVITLTIDQHFAYALTARGLPALFCVFFLTRWLYKTASGVDNKHPPRTYSLLSNTPQTTHNRILALHQLRDTAHTHRLIAYQPISNLEQIIYREGIRYKYIFRAHFVSFTFTGLYHTMPYHSSTHARANARAL